MLTHQEILLRIAASLAAGFILGLERETHGRAAGLRTTALVCVASCLGMILSESFYMEGLNGIANPSGWRPDPARLAAGILTGIGFLGGGAIIRQGNMVHGVTTAAVLWFVTVLGLCFGSGAYFLGTLGFASALLALFVFPRIEKMMRKDSYAELHVTVLEESIRHDEIEEYILKWGIRIKSVDLEYAVTEKQRTFVFNLKFKRSDLVSLPENIIDRIAVLPGVLKVKWGRV